jgi:hypothetical protein
MPIADWGLSQGTVDSFDREKQAEYSPYTGPKPSAGVYRFRVVKDQMRMQPGDEERYPRWSALLYLVPRTREEKRFEGFRCFFSANVQDDKPQWFVPMLDVLGVSETEFRKKTVLTEEGIIKRIGAWRNDGTQELLAEVRYNGEYTNVNWVGPYETSDEEDEEVDEYEDELE